jgi:hypothetical protein
MDDDDFPALLVYHHHSDGTVTVYSPWLNEPPKIIEGPGLKPEEEPPPEKPKIKQRKCKRCNYTWVPRKKQKPVQCPECKSPYWNKKRVKKNTSR